MPSNPSFTILIIGGGVAGLAASIGLRRKGHRVTVLESTSTLQTLGGSLLIPPNAARVLSHYGLWEKFKEAETIPKGNTTYRYEDGSVLEEVDYGAMEGAFGFPVMAIPRARYQKLLYDAAIELGVQVRLSSRVKSLDENVPSVRLTTGDVIKGDIIIGADGIKSTVRSTILRDDDVQPIPESIAYQCTISRADMMSDPLTAPLMEEGSIHSWYAPSRQIISGSDTSSSFYRLTLIFYPSSSPLTSSSDDILAANSASSYRLGSTTYLRDLVSDFEPRVKKTIELVKPEDCFLWNIAHLPKLKSWVGESGRMVLLGDAAHAMVPHLGAVRLVLSLRLFPHTLLMFPFQTAYSNHCILTPHNPPGRGNSRRRRRRPRRMPFPPICTLRIRHPSRSSKIRDPPPAKSRAYPGRCSGYRAV
ncbi:hypothetical protein ONS95_003606 [Cadophora gregata]|uniref:uncharacterized protein n=1 Tax=Cadophora gregata TaxID=51156 RepID=UPI0026DAD4A3|nr:uncharacterized protein ONS95_003606 [Cadophora gregata]KAK0106886.1 hypothetical protein ONS95_003606 [Cadophora gregata]